MIVLPSATYILQLILSAGTADATVSYVDRTATTYALGVTQETAATAATQTVCAAPAASTERAIDFVSIYFKTTGGVVTVQTLNSSGSVTTILFKATLLVGETLNYTHGSGWCVMDTNGNRKEAISSLFSSITNSGLTATRVVFSGTGGIQTDDAGFTFNTTGDILTVGSINVAGTTAPTIGWYTPSGTLLRTPNAVTIDGAVIHSSTSLLSGRVGIGSLPAAANRCLYIGLGVAGSSGLAIGFQIDNNVTAGADSNSLYGGYITSGLLNGGFATTTSYGLRINVSSDAATHYDLYTGAGAVSLNGTVIDMVASGATLTVGVGANNGTVSAGIFTDRTKCYEGDALAEIALIKGVDGEIDHATLPAFAKAIVRRTILSAVGEKIGEEQATERDLGAMISMHDVAIKQITQRLKAGGL